MARHFLFGIDVTDMSYLEAMKALRDYFYKEEDFDPAAYQGPDIRKWIDHIEARKGGVMQFGTDWCADEMDRIERNIWELYLWAKSNGLGSGESDPLPVPNLTLQDILSLLGYIPNRNESFHPEQTAKADLWSQDQEDGWFKNSVDLSAGIPKDLSEIVQDQLYVEWTPLATNQEMLKDYFESGIVRVSFYPDTKICTLFAYKKPELDQKILFDVNVTFDASELTAEEVHPVTRIMTMALENAVNQGQVTKEQILELFKGHMPNRLTFNWVKDVLKWTDWVTYSDRWEQEISFDWNLGDEARPMAAGTREQFLTAAFLNIQTEITDSGMKFIVYKTDKVQEIPEIDIPIEIRFDKTEGE